MAHSAVIVEGPAGGLGDGSVELTTTSTPAFVGIARPLLQPLANLTGASWMTYVTGDNVAEAASLRFAMFRDGHLQEFTTMSIEPHSNNGGVTPDVWQTTTFDDELIVWQTNQTGDFCLITSPCALGDFKVEYPDANLIGLSGGDQGYLSPGHDRTLTACR